MAQKLWEKNFEVNKEIERFTVGRDRELDLYLAKYDVLGSMAHITMLESIGLLGKEELPQLLAELKNIYAIAEKGEFVIDWHGHDFSNVFPSYFHIQCFRLQSPSFTSRAYGFSPITGQHDPILDFI